MFRVKRRSCRSRRRSLLGDRRGSVALEFALVIGPFLLITLGMIEMGLVYYASDLLDQATQETARKIRTGQLQAAAASSELNGSYTEGGGGVSGDSSGSSGDPPSAQELFKENLCSSMKGLISCDDPSRVYFDVRNYQDFDQVDMAPPDTDQDTGMVITEFDPGNRDQVIMVRTYYKWALLIPFMKYLLRDKADSHGNVVLSSTVVFRNEPFPDLVSSGG
ncbi:MAG: hypothetical protein GC201_07875 [Alphaproteobacteria bacterium]|nr:hypothetical protein [Alphaproteobacteria bacterium]